MQVPAIGRNPYPSASGEEGSWRASFMSFVAAGYLAFLHVGLSHLCERGPEGHFQTFQEASFGVFGTWESHALPPNSRQDAPCSTGSTYARVLPTANRCRPGWAGLTSYSVENREGATPNVSSIRALSSLVGLPPDRLGFWDPV